MRILMLGWEYPPAITGGLGVACREIVRTLSERGVEIIFAAPRIPAGIGEGDCAEFLDLEKIASIGQADWLEKRVKRLAATSALRPYLTESAYADMLDRLRSLATGDGTRSVLALSDDYGPDLASEVDRYASVLEVLASTERFDAVHAHDWMTFPAAARIQKRAGVPLVVHVHSLEVDRNTGKPDRNIRKIEQQGLDAADHIIAVSFYTKGRLVEYYDVPEWKVSVVHNAVSRRNNPCPDRTGSPFGKKLVLFLGRVTSQKGPEYFIDAAAKVLKIDPNVWFVMAGSGDMLPTMIERAAKLRIGRNVHFTGFLRGPEVERMYAMSDVYVMPSVSEPFGMGSLEAILYDVPVIVSRESGVAEILEHAVKVDACDVDQLADAIVSLLTDPALRDATVQGCGDAIANVCWDAAGEKIQDVYHMVMGGGD